jgi:hypothetical protein
MAITLFFGKFDVHPSQARLIEQLGSDGFAESAFG